MAHELVTQVAHLSIHDQTLEIQMCKTQDGHRWGVVAAAGLEANEAILDNVDAADAVCEAELVESGKELDRVGVCFVGGGELDGNALIEVDGDVGRLVGCIEGTVGHGPHVVGRGDIWILEDAGFVAAVGQVGVHAPWLSLGRGYGNVVLLGVVEQILPALEAIAELGQPPRGNDLDGGLEGVEGQLEADLVVTLTGAAVGDEAATFLLSNADLGASNNGAGQRGAEEVAALIRSVALHSAEAEFFDKLLLQVENDHLQRANLERLLLHLVPRLLLADVGEEAHDLISFLFADMLVWMFTQHCYEIGVPMSHLRMVEVSRPPGGESS